MIFTHRSFFTHTHCIKLSLCVNSEIFLSNFPPFPSRGEERFLSLSFPHPSPLMRGREGEGKEEREGRGRAFNHHLCRQKIDHTKVLVAVLIDMTRKRNSCRRHHATIDEFFIVAKICFHGRICSLAKTSDDLHS